MNREFPRTQLVLVCADGTGMRPGNRSIPGVICQFLRAANANVDIHCIYEQGLGTHFPRVLGNVMGRGAKEAAMSIYKKLAGTVTLLRERKPESRIMVEQVSWSRGAYIMGLVNGMVSAGGLNLPFNDPDEHVKQAWKDYRKGRFLPPEQMVDIEFALDRVKSTKWSEILTPKYLSDQRSNKVGVSMGIYAADETRESFSPTIWKMIEGQRRDATKGLIQIVVRGKHGDIGGIESKRGRYAIGNWVLEKVAKQILMNLGPVPMTIGQTIDWWYEHESRLAVADSVDSSPITGIFGHTKRKFPSHFHFIGCNR